MGGGHLTRPNFELPQVNEHDPMAEFYFALQRALAGAAGRRFAMPGAWVAFRPPLDEPLYEEDLESYCELSGTERPGWKQVFAPYTMQVLYDDLRADGAGTPSALVLTEEGTRRTVAVRLLPPFGQVLLPPLPECTAALTLQLTERDLALAEHDPETLGESLRTRTEGKAWLHHPNITRWELAALAAMQKRWRKGQGGWF